MDNKRSHPRIKKTIKSEVHFEEGMTFSNSVDLSKGGIFISTPEPLGEGSEINLSLHLPGKKTLDLKGKVRWVRQDEQDGERAGMGIEFEEIDEDVLKTLESEE